MDYERLTTTYWQSQVDRLQRLLNIIRARPEPVAAGRLIPQPDELAIGTGRQLSAAVLFTDISGFSARPSGTPDEQKFLLNILNFYFSEMIRVCEEYAGTVEKNTGDGLMAYFEDNAGDPAENGCKRALAAALTMLYVTQNAINPVLINSNTKPIEFRVGIDYGPITVAQLGAARRFGGLVAIGATANIASKMLDDASPGDILIGEDVHKNIPVGWKQFSQLAKHETGWIYKASGLDYSFYKYIGRWKGPL
ncbi:MAG: adenylate/guanylate cyclase domain-containing protein [Acidobacteriia bacterium]|nr:adenylate/guanylate cyclase domain-containing protein [Terriglobia bacterium]